MNDNDMLTRLKEAGSTGLDLSPGNPLCAWAADEIERLREKVAQAYQVIGFMEDGAVPEAELIRALDYFGNTNIFDPEFLPFGTGRRPKTDAENPTVPSV